MSKTYIPENYKSLLDAYDTQRAIAYIKQTFQAEFSAALNLKRVSAPLFVTEESGLNDNLNGYERAVSFDIPAVGTDAQVVHSLAKWKRLALKRYHFTVGNGLYTDMNAIRRDEELDNVHSIYVDQWDWEKVITAESRNLDYLKLIVRAIVTAICNTNERLQVRYPQLHTKMSREVAFITTQELEDLYPDMTQFWHAPPAFSAAVTCAVVRRFSSLIFRRRNGSVMLKHLQTRRPSSSSSSCSWRWIPIPARSTPRFTAQSATAASSASAPMTEQWIF